MEVMKRNLAQR